MGKNGAKSCLTAAERSGEDKITTRFFHGITLPCVVEPSCPFTFDTFLAFLKGNKTWIESHLLRYGGLLFRGFPVEGAQAFNQAIDAIGLGQPISYIGGDSPRKKVQGKVYTSTEAPPSLKIHLHNEMSYIKNYPRHIYFYCDTPPVEHGETILADARHVLQAMDSNIRERFECKGLLYLSNFYGRSWLLDRINRLAAAHKTWMEALETADKREAEIRCQENHFGYRWLPKDWLQIRYEMPATIEHPLTHEKVWFNQAHLYDYNPRTLGRLNWLAASLIYARKHTVMHEIYYGDGSKIARGDLYRIMDVLDEQTVKFPWQKGDFLVLDNILAMHGRAAFTGPRRILVALTR